MTIPERTDGKLYAIRLLAIAFVAFGAGCFAPPPKLIAVLLGFVSGLITSYVICDGGRP